jgi:hypothetical protein
LLHPAAGRMFAAFRALVTLGSLLGVVEPVLATLFTPFEELLVGSRTASPRSVPSCRLLRLQGVERRDLVAEGSVVSTRTASRPPPGERLVWVGRLAPPVPVRLPRSPSRGRPTFSVSRGCRMATRGPFADSSDRPGRARWESLRVPTALPPWSATLGSVRIPTSSPSAVRWRRARLGRHSRARTARPPLGGVIGIGSSPPVSLWRGRSLVPERCVARGWRRRPVVDVRRSAGQGRGSLLRRAELALRLAGGSSSTVHVDVSIRGPGVAPRPLRSSRPVSVPSWLPEPSRTRRASRAARLECGRRRGSRLADPPGRTGFAP